MGSGQKLMDNDDEEEKRVTINSSLIVYNNQSSGQQSGSVKKVKTGTKNFTKGLNQDPPQKQQLLQEETHMTDNVDFMNYMEMTHDSEMNWNN